MAEDLTAEEMRATVDIPTGYLGTTPMTAKDLRKNDRVLNVYGSLDEIVKKPRVLKGSVKIEKSGGHVEYLDHDDPVHVKRETP